MLKKILLSIIFSMAPLVAMEQLRKKANLESWVIRASHVYIKTTKQSFKIPIENMSTIGDLKEKLLNGEGIPVDQQVLYALEPKLLGLYSKQQLVQNEQNVKEVMNDFNTNKFYLCIMLRNRNSSQ